MSTNTTKNLTIDSYQNILQLLKEAVDAAENVGIDREWSEDFIIAHLPAIFRKEGEDVPVQQMQGDVRLP